MKKIALILGITGQDGSYLAEFLIKKKYQVHGIKRRTSTPNTSRIDHIFDSVNFNNKNLTMHHGDLSDVGSLNRIINEIILMKYIILQLKVMLKFHFKFQNILQM